jgi:hypothetical protein
MNPSFKPIRVASSRQPLGLTVSLVYSYAMVDSHTIAVGTVTLIGVALFIGSMTAVINATSRLLQAASRLTKIIVTFFKNPSHTRCVDRLFKNPSSSALLNIFKKRPESNFGLSTASGFKKNSQLVDLVGQL